MLERIEPYWIGREEDEEEEREEQDEGCMDDLYAKLRGVEL